MTQNKNHIKSKIKSKNFENMNIVENIENIPTQPTNNSIISNYDYDNNYIDI